MLLNVGHKLYVDRNVDNDLLVRFLELESQRITTSTCVFCRVNGRLKFCIRTYIRRCTPLYAVVRRCTPLYAVV